MSSPHIPLSNGFIEQQVKMFKTTLSTGQDTATFLQDLLLDLQLIPITPMMLSPREILHNRNIQCPGRPSTLIGMEAVWNHLITKRRSRNNISIGQTMHNPCQSLTMVRKYNSCPQLIHAHTSQA